MLHTNWELVHRYNSVVVGAFIVSHLGVHLMAAISPEAHTTGLSFVRQFYRDPLFEALLIISISVQIYSGYAELKLIGKKGWRLVRNLSGAILMMFMLVHVGTVFYARHVDHVSTDFFWAAGSFAHEPLAPIAMAFYGLGVFSFFAHMIAILALAWTKMPSRLLVTSWGASLAVTTLIILTFAGKLYPIEIPDDVREHYETNFAPILQLSSTQ